MKTKILKGGFFCAKMVVETQDFLGFCFCIVRFRLAAVNGRIVSGSAADFFALTVILREYRFSCMSLVPASAPY